jgi:hypothetical protein
LLPEANEVKVTMDQKEKMLYHQIHPLKLLVDWGTMPVSLLLFWKHKPALALLVGFLPSIVATALMMRYADLELW